MTQPSTNMRVAVAGTCGLALLIAREINDETSHQLVILSRTVSVQSTRDLVNSDALTS
jgi:hypothetical protein